MRDAAQGKRVGAGDSPARAPWFPSLRRRYLERCVSLGWTPLEARYLERAAKNPDGPAYLWIPGARP